MKGCRINFCQSFFFFEKSGIKSKLYRAQHYFLFGKETCLLSAAKGKKNILAAKGKTWARLVKSNDVVS